MHISSMVSKLDAEINASCDYFLDHWLICPKQCSHFCILSNKHWLCTYLLNFSGFLESTSLRDCAELFASGKRLSGAYSFENSDVAQYETHCEDGWTRIATRNQLTRRVRNTRESDE